MTHASLFSGIGGFDLAAEWAGWDNKFNCEIDRFCRQVLKYHFPNAVQYEDIKTTDFTIWRGRIDVLTGGFPCQPFSTAGKRKGTADNRYLWPEMLRAIREICPRWVVGENVFGIVNWSEGLVFEQVQADLEAEGYKVQAFVIPACAVGANHRRDRTWFVAHAIENPECYGLEVRKTDEERTEVREFWDTCAGSADRLYIQERTSSNPYCEWGYMSPRKSCKAENVRSGDNGEPKDGGKPSERYYGLHDVLRDDSNAQGERLSERNGESSRAWTYTTNERYYGLSRWENFPTQSPVCSRDDGFPIPMDGITFPKWRVESIKAYGNAIVPQVAYRIFDTINSYERL